MKLRNQWSCISSFQLDSVESWTPSFWCSHLFVGLLFSVSWCLFGGYWDSRPFSRSLLLVRTELCCFRLLWHQFRSFSQFETFSTFSAMFIVWEENHPVNANVFLPDVCQMRSHLFPFLNKIVAFLSQKVTEIVIFLKTYFGIFWKK